VYRERERREGGRKNEILTKFNCGSKSTAYKSAPLKLAAIVNTSLSYLTCSSL
jgi:hypothetical protein